MRDRARAFLELNRIALVGVSRDPRDFSRVVLRELLQRGLDPVPVNPTLAEAEGRRCWARIGEIAPPVKGALLLTPPAQSAEVVRACLEAGVRELWLHRGAGAGAATPEALRVAREAGVEPVTDLCPFMALEGAGWLHRAHALFRGAGRMPGHP
ncbi:MAG: CoA-binding protein [Deltaproteobacteria bacterium]|nr:CoA-binding protein [Deltaproteobacteria bacterium]